MIESINPHDGNEIRVPIGEFRIANDGVFDPAHRDALADLRYNAASLVTQMAARFTDQFDPDHLIAARLRCCHTTMLPESAATPRDLLGNTARLTLAT